MDLGLVSKVVELYGTTLRREREVYVSHVLRVATNVEAMGFNERGVLLALLHDILELDLPGYTLKSITSLLDLTPNESSILEILTARHGESSQEHYERIVQSNEGLAYAIKYYDNLDNAVFAVEDYAFTQEKLLRDPEKEILKYQERARMFKALLRAKGYEVV